MVVGNRERGLNAAMDLLASGGVRALTHRSVDERAGLPAGSTSNYFRTRAALFQGVTEHMVRTELPLMGGTTQPDSADEFLTNLVAMYDFLVGPNRVMTSARLVLFVEAGHDDELRAMLAAGRSHFIASLHAQLTRLGASNPELATQLIAVGFEGLFLHDIAGHGQVDPRPVLQAIVTAALL